MKNNPKLDKAINKLADKIENGHLLSSMHPVEFINQVIKKLESNTPVIIDKLAIILVNAFDEMDYGMCQNLCPFGSKCRKNQRSSMNECILVPPNEFAKMIIKELTKPQNKE